MPKTEANGLGSLCGVLGQVVEFVGGLGGTSGNRPEKDKAR